MIAYLLLIPTLIWASVSDIRTRTIPDTVHVLILISGAVLILGYGQPWKPRVTALLLVGTVTLALSLCISGIGGGDIKMMAAIAFALGFVPGLYSIMAALTLALLYMFVTGHKNAAVPLAPFLSVGCAVIPGIQKYMEMI